MISWDWPGLILPLAGLAVKCATLLKRKETGILGDSLFRVQRQSTCSSTGHSPKSNLVCGDTDSITGNAVPVTATSLDDPITQKGRCYNFHQLNKYKNPHYI